MSDISISSSLFHRRADSLFSRWATSDPDELPLSSEIENVLICAGNSDEENPYRKGSALQTYLLGYEFPSTLMLLNLPNRRVTFVVSSTKAKLLKPLQSPSGENTVEVVILTRTKDEAENYEQFKGILETIGSGVRHPEDTVTRKLTGCVEMLTYIGPVQSQLGTLPKDKMAGKFVNEWNAAVTKSGVEVKELDVALGVSFLLAVKDSDEIKNAQHAATMTQTLMAHFSDAMAQDLDDGRKVTHEQLGERIEAKLEDPKFWKKLEAGGDGFETGFGDWCYSPIIQSGGNYDLKSSAQTDDQRLKPGVILCSLGIRYKSYCSNVGRTYMIDPDATQEKNYLFLVDLQKFVVAGLKDGKVAKDLYADALEKIEKERSDLLPYFVKTLGFAMGLEFRDAGYALGAKCSRTLKTGMVFSVTIGFNNIPNLKAGGIYAISLVDTVIVGENAGKMLSEGMKSKDSVFFFLEDDEQPTKKAAAKPAPRRGAASGAVVKSSLRSENREVDAGAANRRISHQKDLAERRQKEGLEKYSEEGGKGGGSREKQWKRFESYVKESQLPEAVANQKIMVDARRNTIILPINGFAVPFHVHTLKSLIKQEEGDFTVLRFMFTTPGAITGKKEDTPFEDASATFIRGITYRSTDSFRFAEIHKEINDLKKAANKREAERKELSDVVEQDKLAEVKGKRPIKLTDVQVRPAFDGKRNSGDVEIHSNGIRYQSSLKSEQKIDVLFSNIKHLFFQPCDNELIAILHVHLKNPIVIGKKKAKDVQFFREASDASFDETGNKKRRKNYHDEDELQSEQEERKRRADLNKYFKAFADKIAEASNGRVEVDIPFRELGFGGVPFRSNVLLQPTTDALVYLTEPPFLVLTLADIEIAHLERVQYGLKNFDMVFVFQDFTRTPVHVNTIPQNQIDNVKDWLDSVDIPFSEGPVNLNWGSIMQVLRDDPYKFFEDGGWSFLTGGDDENGSDSDSEDESEFEASDVDDESESGSAFSEDASASDSGSDAGGDDGSSGEDWDEMEARLEKGEDSDDGGKKAKKSSSGKKR